MIKKSCKIFPVVAFLVMGGLTSLSAQRIIYSDDFGGSREASLNGCGPATRPGTEEWAARLMNPISIRDPRADGSISGGASGLVSGVLPFSLESGKVYTFTVNATIINPLNDGSTPATHWAGIAFRSTSSVDGTLAGDADFASLIIRRNGGAQLTTRGGSGPINMGAGTFEEAASWGIEIDTTQIPWTADFLIDGDPVESVRELNPSLVAGTAYISIGQFASASVRFHELSLKVTP